MQANLGYLFYHGIYDISPRTIESNANKVNDFLAAKIENTQESIGNHHFSLYTTYPGLITGVGMAHGVKGDDMDFKIGFYFDHTTGLPHIPGSSVKGVLRSVFPCLDKNQESQLVKFKWLHALIKGCKEDTDFLQKEYAPFEAIRPEQKKEIEEIEKEIFDGMINEEYISIYKRDIFHDAVINTTQVKFLGTDYITPHLQPLKNPTPIQFLKILPNIEFVFHFQLNGGILSAEQKRLLFQKILLTLGIGAKTNVGYGQLEDRTPPPPSEKDVIKAKTHERMSKISIKIAEKQVYETTIQAIDKDYCYISLNFEGEVLSLKKKLSKITGAKPQVNMPVKVVFSLPFNNLDNPVFSLQF